MNITKTNKLLLTLFIISFFFMILSIIFSNESKTRQKEIRSALINPKFEKTITEIQIQKNENSIILRKAGNFWFSEQSNVSSLADSKIIESLIQSSVKVRNIYKFSSKNNNPDSINSTTIDFLSNNTPVGTITFTESNSLTNRINFVSDSLSYETEDNFSQFLTIDFNYWSNGLLFPEISNTTQISYFSSNKNMKINDSNPDFLNISSKLLKLRHGHIAENIKDAAIEGRICIEDGYGTVSELYIYSQTGSESYFCSKAVKKSNLSSAEEIKSFEKLNAVFEISPWTLKSIIEILEN